MKPAPQNGIDDPEIFEYRGIVFAFKKCCTSLIPSILSQLPPFLQMKDGKLVVDWRLYGMLEEDRRGRLNDVLWAAGILTSNEEGALRIRWTKDKNNRYVHGPESSDQTGSVELFFAKDRMDDAIAYITAYVHACVEVDEAPAMRGIELEIVECVRKAEYAKIEIPVETTA
jgi:hypothetical protein